MGAEMKCTFRKIVKTEYEREEWGYDEHYGDGNVLLDAKN